MYTTGLLQRYVKRPFSLEHLTLADWVAWYDLSQKPYVKKSFQNDTDKLPLETGIDENDDTLPDESRSNKETNRKDHQLELLEVFGLTKKKTQRNTTVN